MKTTQIFILSLLFFGTFFSMCKVGSAFLNGYSVPSNGEVRILKDEHGLYVEAEYNLVDKITGKWLLAIQNKQTMLPNTCIKFEDYTCAEPNCKEDSEIILPVSYPYFSTQFTTAKTSITLDDKNWKLEGAIIGRECSENIKAYGSGRNGIIGLGEKANFGEDKIFSIYLSKDEDPSYLLFKSDLGYTTSETPKFETEANSAWTFKVEKIGVKDTESEVDYGVTFDPHVKEIGLPEAGFTFLINSLKTLAEINCNELIYKPVCEYTGAIQDLPNLELKLKEQSIIIPPSVYAEAEVGPDDKLEKITLSLKVLSTTHGEDNYVTDGFKDTIILGSKFMEQYYVVFDGTTEEKYKVRLFEAGKKKSPSPKSGNGWTITIIVILVLGAVGAGAYWLKKKKSDDSYSGMGQ